MTFLDEAAHHVFPTQQPELFEPDHGLTPWQDRLPWSASERIYLETWKAHNVRHPAVNSGRTYLEGLMRGRVVTQRDAVVAASFAQWLGTNCGLGYVMECERAIGRDVAVRDSWSGVCRTRASFAEQARVLASSVASEPIRKCLEAEIAQALEAASRSRFRAVVEDKERPRGILLRETGEE